MTQNSMFSKKISLIGAGRAGFAIAALLANQGYKFLSVIDKNPEKGKRCGNAVSAVKYGTSLSDLDNNYDFLIIAVPDMEIEKVSSQLAGSGMVRSGSVIAHLSGAAGSDILDECRQRGASVASMHPCMTFTENRDNYINSFYLALEGDKKACDELSEVIISIGNKPFIISRKDKPLYHAACVTVSNFLVTLFSAGTEMIRMQESEVPVNVFLPLIKQTIDNIEKSGAERALTGPVSRGDIETVNKHINILKSQKPELALMYAALGLQSISIAEKQGADSDKLEKIKELFLNTAGDVLNDYK